MQKQYKLNNLFFILLLCFTLQVSAQQNEVKMLMTLLTEAKGYKTITPIMDIIRKYPNIIRYIPYGTPVDAQKSRISSPYGYRSDPINGSGKFHSGIDFAAPLAMTIHATADGEIIYSGRKQGYGNVIIIRHKWGFETRYAHLSVRYLEKGFVRRGQVIGFVGSTGRSTGNHLHYEVIKNRKHIQPYLQ